MIEFDDAQRRLSEAAPAPTQSESVALRQLAGRVLAQDVHASLDMPSADNSAMDGYAVRIADLRAGDALIVSQTVYAGEAPSRLEQDTVARVFTGSLVPQGADTVIMQEDVAAEGDQVTISGQHTMGQHIRRRGEDMRSGALLLAAGTRLDAAHIALLATQGLADVPVFPQLRVGILTTGDELVPPGAPRSEHQIYNSNAAMLTALVEGMGAQATTVLHARDDMASHTEAFKTLAEQCDLVLSVGGVSVGDKDIVKPALHALGATLDMWRVRMKPGKPVALAHLNGVPVVGLPGNPVSAYAVFTLLVTPLIRRMQGRTDIFPYVSHVTLRTDRMVVGADGVFTAGSAFAHADLMLAILAQ
ncbi:MAG: molybdopterin molybdenumtransferase MoeA, partial [Comamonadaceae bacterium]